MAPAEPETLTFLLVQHLACYGPTEADVRRALGVAIRRHVRRRGYRGPLARAAVFIAEDRIRMTGLGLFAARVYGGFTGSTTLPVLQRAADG